ncbi:MAG: hypothetical protein QW156_00715 [Candidatus Aenigmatarchaeota archaeon]
MNYPLYTYQKRKQYEMRLKEAFPVSEILKQLEEIPEYLIKELDGIEIVTKVTKAAKQKRVARKFISHYEEYVEEALPEQYKEKEKRVIYLHYPARSLEPPKVDIPFSYELKEEVPKLRWVEINGRRYKECTKSYSLTVKFLENKKNKDLFLDIVSVFLYCQPLHMLDLLEYGVYGFKGNERTALLPSKIYTKMPFRMPIWGTKEHPAIESDVLSQLGKIFSFEPFLLQTYDQLLQRHPFVWCLTLQGEPIPRRFQKSKSQDEPKRELSFESHLDIKKFFEEERGVEYYRSNDKVNVDKVDTLILEFDPPLRDKDPATTWKKIVEDEERSLLILKNYGIKLESIEENFSGNKSLQRLIHINPPVSYEEARNMYYFLAVLHKFEAASDSYFYTIDKSSGLSRVQKTLADYTYGKKKEIKVVPTVNLKREPIHCSVPLVFDFDKARFEEWVYNYNFVRDVWSYFKSVLNSLKKDENLSIEDKIFKPQNFFEKNATDPNKIREMIKEYQWLISAMDELEPSELDLWKKDWLKEKFS